MNKKTFNNDWWYTTEITPPDPWAYIVSDFQWSIGVLAKIETKDRIKSIEIGHFPEKDSKYEEKLDFAFNTIKEFQGLVIEKISHRTIDLEFLWIWGEYQKAFTIIEIIFPEYKRTRSMVRHSIENRKDDAKQWYVLWFEWYKTSKKKKGRKSFDDFFGKFLLSIKRNERLVPEHFQNHIMQLIDKYVENPKDLKNLEDLEDLKYLEFTKSFKQKDFNGDLLKTYTYMAEDNKDSLPPVGEEYYPLK